MVSPVPNEEGLRALGQQISSGNGRRGRSGIRGGDGGVPDAGGGSRGGGSRGGGSSGRGGHGHGRSRKRHRGLRRALLICSLVVVVLIAGVVGYGFYLNSEVHRVDVKGLAAGETVGRTAGTENILMVGSTSRCALKVQTPRYGLCTQGVNGVNSDVIMILHLNPAVPSVSILSIPRTTFVPNSRKTGTGNGAYKIDAALYQGPTQLVAAIEEAFGIPIQRFVELNFDSFASVVTALGGITMYFPEPVFDEYSGLNIQTPGCHHLNGVEALEVVRARHLQYKGPGVTATTPHTWPQEAQSDLARIRRDHEFLRVLASEVSKRGLSNPLTDQQLVAAVAPQLTVDSGFSTSHMVNLILTYHSVNINKAPQLTLPVRVDTFGTYTFEGRPIGTVVFPSEPQDQSVIDQFLGITNDTDSMTGGPLPSPASVTVSVLNGTGVYNQASDTAATLGRLGFKIVGTGTSTPVGKVSETMVTYAHRTPTDEAAAELVARSLSGTVIMTYGPTTDGADVTVTTGTDFSVDATAPSPATPAPAAHGTTTTAPPTTTTAPPSTTGSTGSTGSSSSTGSTGATPTTAQTTAFAPPTSPVNPLKPYDPRACTASGGEGP